jgi:hypothetical protein
VQLYKLGTVANGYRTGAITFPYIDINGNIRAVQVKQFDEQNHTTGTDFLHSIIEKHHTRNNTPLPDWLQAYIHQEKRVSCLFGEHLLSKYPQNPVALVEAPKTAVYGTLYFGAPETPNGLIWLAVYNKSSFSFDKLKALKGRFVYVFPDLSKDRQTFNEWQSKAKDFESRLSGTRFIFSDLLEQLAPDRDKENGNDLADYLIKQDWQLFRKKNVKNLTESTEHQNSVESEACEAQKTIFFESNEHQDFEINKELIKQTVKQFKTTFSCDWQLLELTRIRCIEENGIFCDASEDYFNQVNQEYRLRHKNNITGLHKT